MIENIPEKTSRGTFFEQSSEPNADFRAFALEELADIWQYLSDATLDPMSVAFDDAEIHGQIQRTEIAIQIARKEIRKLSEMGTNRWSPLTA